VGCDNATPAHGLVDQESQRSSTRNDYGSGASSYQRWMSVLFPKPLRYALFIWVIVFAFFAVPGLVVGNWVLDYELEMSGQHTTGVIVESQPNNHGSCRYRYRVSARTFVGTDQNCPIVTVGSPVEVTYSRSRPSVSVTGNGSGLLAGHLLIALLVPTFLAIGVGRMVARRSSRQMTQHPSTG